MRFLKNAQSILILGIVLFFLIPSVNAKTKEIKRPKNRVGVLGVDRFAQGSFHIYDKKYKYNGYAEASKNALITIYKISVNRLETNGKDETEPVSDNGTSGGKAQNKRVEFIII